MKILKRVCEQYPFKLYCYCMMGNHLHLQIATIEDEIWKIMKNVNWKYTMYYNKKYDKVGHLFQGRYYSDIISSDSHLLQTSKLERILKASGTLPSEMLENRAGVFVTIKLNDRLRGCIGTIEPARKNIAEEIIYNAISAGTRDPRFPPIEKNELNKLSYSVDILKEPEPIKSINELDTAKYGVIVRKDMRSGLLLPDLEGIDTSEEQVSIALQKAGISPQEKYSIERFEVIRHK